MKWLLCVLLALPLLSIAPAPDQPSVYWTRIAVQTSAQACTWETAPARLRQRVNDTIGWPYGEVSAWSCSGDSQAVIAELNERSRVMQAEAAAYRAAHPIGGMP